MTWPIKKNEGADVSKCKFESQYHRENCEFYSFSESRERNIKTIIFKCKIKELSFEAIFVPRYFKH